LDRFVQRPVQRAAYGVKAVRPLDCLPRRFRRFQAHSYVNAANDEYAILSFHLPGYIRGQFSVAGIDLARFQRASKSAHHSTGGRRNDIVNRRRMGLLQLCRVHFVVLGNGPVDTVDYRLGLARQMRDAKRPLPALDARFGNINDITHDFLLPAESIRSTPDD
jgi:hypothetical protein